MLLPLSSVTLFLAHAGSVALLVFGFGFVIFWHELGHFLAAKWVGIKVEQFAVGFGQALCSWRKGVGFRMGNTQKEYRQRVEKYLADREVGDSKLKEEKLEYTDRQVSDAAMALGLGDTEYRLNWLPLGGYVKMLGQDDLKPDARDEDPRAYNKKSVSARMLVISAGVIMNVILAAIGFMVLFLIGFHVPPAYAGMVVPGSPAQRAGMHIGDRCLTFDGKSLDDFTKMMLNTALAKEGEPVALEIERPLSDDPNEKRFQRMTLTVTPSRGDGDKNFLAIGFAAPHLLKAVPNDEEAEDGLKKAEGLYPPQALALRPGDTIVAVNGEPVTPQDYIRFNEIVQSSYGKPITLRIKNAAGEHDAVTGEHFMEPFSSPFSIAGIIPRTQVYSFTSESSAQGKDKLQIGDVIAKATLDSDPLPNPTRDQLLKQINEAGHQSKPLNFVVVRNGTTVNVDGIKANLKLDRKEDRFGMGIQLIYDEKQAVVAGVVDGSAAKAAGLTDGDTITAVDGQPVQNWFDVQRLLKARIDKAEKGKADKSMKADEPIAAQISYKRGADAKTATMTFATPEQIATVEDIRYQTDVQQMNLMAEYNIVRQTKNPAIAFKWGVFETRDFILQFYLTLRRMVGGSVSPSNMMGPVGIFVGGARFAFKGADWLIWFLCMISANLAVVNFLPIPVVDGGQFMFLMLEKAKGKPLSTRTMVIAQYVGLAFLAAVVLFVTYNDILRWF